jgi:hypothetical protein
LLSFKLQEYGLKRNFICSSDSFRRVKEVWESKKELLRETGKQVVQQLAEATAAVAPTQELNESSIPGQAVSLCAIQVISRFSI